MAEKPKIKVEDGTEEDPKTTEEQASEDHEEEGGTPTTENDSQEQEESSEEDQLWDGISEEHPIRDLVKSLRDEAAAKRTTAKSVRDENQRLEAALSEAKTEEDVQSAVSDWQAKVEEKEVEVLRERMARRFKISDDFVEFLTGTDEEDLEQQARKLKGATSRSRQSGEPVGGRSPKGDQPTPSDYADKIRKQRRGRRR